MSTSGVGNAGCDGAIATAATAGAEGGSCPVTIVGAVGSQELNTPAPSKPGNTASGSGSFCGRSARVAFAVGSHELNAPAPSKPGSTASGSFCGRSACVKFVSLW
mmetsp:Transcript_30136/g.40840  ORF Transcript_30136/g.40840 Transcript_30136/m.40840 type:complete len:105 (+) Transcript_30136:585-899(+)